MKCEKLVFWGILGIIATFAYDQGRPVFGQSQASVAPMSTVGDVIPAVDQYYCETTNQQLIAIEDLIVNIGILYAKSDPQYAPILKALGIKDAQDVREIVCVDLNGGGMRAVVAFLVMRYAEENPEVAELLEELNIHSVEDIIRLLENPDGLDMVLYDLAYEYASHDPQYAPWLELLGIHSGADLKKVVDGVIAIGGNLLELLARLGAEHLHHGPDDQDPKLNLQLHLGSLQGLPLKDLPAIVQIMRKPHS